MKVITVGTQKGGVGKTATAWALGTGLHARGYKVLLVDLDPQSNLSFVAGVDLLNLKASLYDVFKGKADINDAVIELEPGLCIAVGSIALASADREFTGARSFYMLRDALHKMHNNVDHVIIDVPPYLGTLTENALTASDDLIVPVKADIFALQGAGQLAAFVDEQRRYTNPQLRVAGVLVTCVDSRTNLAKMMLDQMQSIADLLGTKVFESRIRQAVAVPEAALRQTSLIKSYKREAVTKDYESFIDEYLERGRC